MSMSAVPLGQVLDLANGKSIKPGDVGEYPAFGSNGLIGGSPQWLHQRGIIIGRVGAYCGSVQYCPRPFWASDNTIVAQPKDEGASCRYFYYLLRAADLNQHAGGSAQPLLTQTVLKRLVLSVADVPAQHKIAAVLSAYDDLIENNTRRIAILEEMARAIYQEWFVNFRFPGHEDVPVVESELGPIPEGWEVRCLEEVAAINARSIKKGRCPENIRYVDISSVSPGRIDKVEAMPWSEAPSRARRLVAHGDVIWSTVRPNRRSYALVLDPTEELVVSTGFAVLSPQEVPFSLLYLATTTDAFSSYLEKRATGAAYPAVTGSVFEQARLIVPLKSIGELFHERVEPLLLLRTCLERELDLLRQTRDLLLPKLVSGEVDVSDLEIDLGDAA